MSEKHELSQEELNKVNGGVSTSITTGYWYGVYGDYIGFDYTEERYGYISAGARNAALIQAKATAQQIGVENITTNKGYIY